MKLITILFFVLASVSSAITIGTDQLVGYWAPGSSYNNPTETTFAADLLIDWSNGGPAPTNTDAVFLITNQFTNLPDLDSTYTRNETGIGGTFTGYNYIVGKYANISYLFYLGGGTYELPTTYARRGLSHYQAFGESPVPDGGTTVALVGAGLGLFALVRRFW